MPASTPPKSGATLRVRMPTSPGKAVRDRAGETATSGLGTLSSALGKGAGNDSQHVDHILLFLTAASVLDRSHQLMQAGVEIAAQTAGDAPAARQAGACHSGIEPHSRA